MLRGHHDFPWHKDAGCLNSSQALAVSVFGTFQTLHHLDAVMAAVAPLLGVSSEGPWQVGLERVLDKRLLGETRPTQLDAVACSPRWVVALECKFTESDGGGCSQIKDIETEAGSLPQCDGDYHPQVNPLTRKLASCALTAKGIRYWDRIPALLGYPADGLYEPCPFKGGWYQWMRNVVAADALATKSGRRGAAALVYADGPFAVAGKVSRKDRNSIGQERDGWADFVQLTSNRLVPIAAVSYQALLQAAVAGCGLADRPLLAELTAWATETIWQAAKLRA